MPDAGFFRESNRRDESTYSSREKGSNFHLFLNWLSPDPEQAGERYENIRRRLISYFRSRGCRGSQELADETIDRVIKKSDWIAENYAGDPQRYFYAVGKNVYFEHKRQPRVTELPANLSFETTSHGCQLAELRSQMLAECLSRLKRDERNLILAYYSERHQSLRRRALSKELGISPQALRVRAHRIRRKLRRGLKLDAEAVPEVQNA